MKAHLFYQTQCDMAAPVELISPELLQSFLKKANETEKNHIQNQQFNGKTGEICLIPSHEGQLTRIYLGVEDNKNELALAQAALKCPPGVYYLASKVSDNTLLQWGLAQYRFDQYKQAQNKPRILCIDETTSQRLLPQLEALFLTRDLINRPANDLTPEKMAEVVEELATQHQAEFKQWVAKALLEENYPGIYAVGCAAESAPRLLSLHWGKKTDPLITLVGKGVCFDSGGLDIKPAIAMRLMKKDMGGAAQVLGLAHWIMSRGLAIQLQVYIPAVENAIGPGAFRPGDVLRMRNGLTVEIDNTDAEGRLILADALSKSCEDKPELLIDFSTLTGAARVAVGTEISAMFCNDDKLAEALTKAALEAADPLWRLPLFEGYKSMLDSNIADLINASPSFYAGAITAGLFLQYFISEGTPWVHFDVMAWNLGNKPGKPEGGEAMGIRAVMAYLQKRFGD